jgi:hypothetical protein
MGILLYCVLFTEKTFLKGAKKKLGERKYKFLFYFAKLFFAIILIGFTAYIVFPLSTDTFILFRKGVSWSNVENIRVNVSTCHRFPILWFLHQSVYVKKQGDYILLFDFTLIRDRKNYEFYYLKQSKYILYAKRLPDGPLLTDPNIP